MKGKPFQPIPDPDGVLSPPPRKPPTAVATSAPMPEEPGEGGTGRRGRDEVVRGRRGRRRPALFRLAMALDGAAGSIVRAFRRAARI
jgi:hypothetical protein